MNAFRKICLALTLIGGINWGLYGILRLDLVALVFGGSMTAGARLVYSVIGIASAASVSLLFKRFEDDEDRIKPPSVLPEKYGEPHKQEEQA